MFGIWLLGIGVAWAETVGRIVAVVNEEAITQQELQEAVAQTNPADRKPGVSEGEFRSQVLSRMIEQHLVLQKAKQMGLTVSEEELEEALGRIRADFPSQEAFESQLAKQGLSPDRFRQHYRNQMIIKRMVDREVRPRVSYSPKELEQYYEQHAEEFKHPQRLHLFTILIRHQQNHKEDRKAHLLAKALWRRLKGGESFEALARQFSEGPRKEEGGDLGWVEERHLLKEIAEALRSLKVGEMTPVLETTLGYHLFLLKERQEPGTVPFRKAKPAIEKKVWEAKMRDRYNQWIEGLRKEAYLEIY